MDSESRLLWSRRDRVDVLVIMDWDTEDLPHPQPLQVLLDAITKVLVAPRGDFTDIVVHVFFASFLNKKNSS